MDYLIWFAVGVSIPLVGFTFIRWQQDREDKEERPKHDSEMDLGEKYWSD